MKMINHLMIMIYLWLLILVGSWTFQQHNHNHNDANCTLANEYLVPIFSSRESFEEDGVEEL